MHKVLGKLSARGSASSLMDIIFIATLACSISSPVCAATALPMRSNLVVNEKTVDVEAYMIEGNNYFKLRDLAMALQGTEKAFDVAWDGNLNAINLMTGKAYTAAGGEDVRGAYIEQEAAVSTSKIYKDGEVLEMAAYQVGNNNYFKLRDFAKAFDVNLEWNEKTNTVELNIPLNNGQNAEADELMIQRDALKLPVKPISPYSTSQAAYENILLYMMDANIETYEVAYNSSMYEVVANGELQQVIKAAYEEVFSKYIEQFGFTQGLGIEIEGNEGGGTIVLTLYPIYVQGYSLTYMKEQFFEGSVAILEALNVQGEINQGMTETEKAEVLYKWVALNLEYDTNETDESLTGYGAITNKKAVCQGYTALYNTLCKLVGINVRGVVGTSGPQRIDHSWTLATLDGKKAYIDVTYGDPPPDRKGVYDLRYFMPSEEFLSSDHFWDKSIVYR